MAVAVSARETGPGTDGREAFFPSSGTATTAPVTSTAAATVPRATLRSVVRSETGGGSASDAGSASAESAEAPERSETSRGGRLGSGDCGGCCGMTSMPITLRQ